MATQGVWGTREAQSVNTLQGVHGDHRVLLLLSDSWPAVCTAKSSTRKHNLHTLCTRNAFSCLRFRGVGRARKRALVLGGSS
eukprot:197241-Rhodomonas_salina.2